MSAMKTAIIYVRVSTKEQADEGVSLDTQLQKCREWAANNGVRILKEFVEEGKSAKNLKRPKMTEMLEFVAFNHKQIDFLLAYNMSRLSRNVEDFYTLSGMLTKADIQIKEPTSSTDSKPSDRIIRGMSALVADYENAIKSETTRDNMAAQAAQGYRMNRAPYGLRNVRTALNKATVEAVPDVAEKIALVLTEFSKGTYTQREIVLFARSIGLTQSNGKPMSFQAMKRLLLQPLYAGLDRSKHTEGRYVDSEYAGLVPKHVYYANQELLKHGKGTKSLGYRLNNPDFPLRRFVTCHICNNPLRGSSPRGRTKRYAKYHCQTCKGVPSINNDELHEDFLEQLADLTLNDQAQKLMKTIIARVWRDEVRDLRSRQSVLHTHIVKLEERKQQALDKMLDGQLTVDEKNAVRERADKEIALTNAELANLNDRTGVSEDAIDYAISFIGNVPRMWNDASIDMKVKLQTMIFPEGISYDLKARRFGTARLSALYRLVTIKKEPSKTDDSLLVTLPGIEPGLPG